MATDPSDAEIVADVFAGTVFVVTVNVAEVIPAGIVTVAGADASEELVAKDTTSPPAGAAAVKVTVPVTEYPPKIDVGLTLIEDKDTAGGALTVRVADSVTPASVAEIFAAVWEATVTVSTVKTAWVWPFSTVTLKGTVAEV